MTPVIQVEHLSKRYRIGAKPRHDRNLTEVLVGGARGTWQKLRGLVIPDGSAAGTEDFWALKDASFEVQPGEVVGIIGLNGAGKSTLLKILSQIVEPTSGRAVVRGRMGSLLEVGTGFHPELTGRENVYLNGSILGMSKREIDRKFDDIVGFSEIDQFLDTPVKRYSSGMYVRLAFAVAAQLEPEILIVDEVLAVGDQAFQRKCIGKLHEVGRSGRTVLFVSHSMQAIMSLCTKVMVVERGRCGPLLEPTAAVGQYYATIATAANGDLLGVPRYQASERPPILQSISVRDDEGRENMVSAGRGITISIGLANYETVQTGVCGVAITDEVGHRVVIFHTQYHAGIDLRPASRGRAVCRVNSLPLVPGTYFIDLLFGDGFHVIERVERASQLQVLFEDVLNTGQLPKQGQGHVILPCKWQDLPESA